MLQIRDATEGDQLQCVPSFCWLSFGIILMFYDDITNLETLYYQLAQQRETLSYKIKLNHVSQQTVLNLS